MIRFMQSFMQKSLFFIPYIISITHPLRTFVFLTAHFFLIDPQYSNKYS